MTFTDEGTYPTVKSLLDLACAQTIDFSELLNALQGVPKKTYPFLQYYFCPSRIPILVQFFL